MSVVNKLNHMLKRTLTISAVFVGIEDTQAAQRPTIDPFTFCTNSCNDRCNAAKDPLAPKLKAQCQKMCADQIDQVATLQMSKMAGEMGKKFRQARGQEKVDMLKDAPIYRCLSGSATASQEAAPAPISKPTPKLESMSAAQMASAQRAAATQKPAVKADTRSAAQRESDEQYEASLRAAAEQKAAASQAAAAEPAETEGQQSESTPDVNQDIQDLKSEVKDVEAKLDQLAEKLNAPQA